MGTAAAPFSRPEGIDRGGLSLRASGLQATLVLVLPRCFSWRGSSWSVWALRVSLCFVPARDFNGGCEAPPADADGIGAWRSTGEG